MYELLKKYNRPVPRYTSYPTAPHFKHEMPQVEYRDILKAIDEEDSISLYIHIPFCRYLCTYCGCNTKIVDHDAPIYDYFNTLKKEVILAAEAIGTKQKISSIHFGGGTPNFAPIDALAGLFDLIGDKFTLSDKLIISMETDPRLLTKEQAKALVDLGVNRISMGVQDFQADVQEAINRIQPFEMVRDCVEYFRDAGIKSINFDMIYGLPLQTIDKIEENMKMLQEIAPDRVALFGYAHVPWFKSHQKKLEDYKLPDTFERFDMEEASRENLIKAGYQAIGIDHFAMPDDELAIAFKNKSLHRNFQGYTTDNEQVLLGLGQTSISDYSKAYVQNTLRNKEYRERVSAGEFPIIKSCLLSDDDIYRRRVIEQIMCYSEVDLKLIEGGEEFSFNLWQNAKPILEGFVEDNLLTIGDMKLSIKKDGRVFTRLIASAFDNYLQQNNDGIKRHAQAI